MIKRAFTYAVTLMVVLVFLTVTAVAASYETTRYDVQINVKSDNSAYINEKITVDIGESIHGIYRYIPLKQTIDYRDKNGEPLKKVRNSIKIEDISVSKYPFEVSRKGDNRLIKIGDPDSYISGEQAYNLSYRVRMYDDKIKEYDSFFYNVLPTDWETPIEKAEITVVMPKKFDAGDVEVVAGAKGKRDETDKIRWKVEGNTVSIQTKETLPKGTGITMGIKLPEGYFEDELNHNKTYMTLYIIGLLVALITVFLWYKYGRDPHHVQTVEFYPPEGMNPAEIGYVIDGRVDKKDVVSLILYFVQRGYMTIEEKGKKDFVLSKKVDNLPPEAKGYEQTLFTGLFKKGESVVLSNLDDDFYDYYQATADGISSHFKEKRSHRIFAKKANVSRVGALLLVLIGIFLGGFMVSKMYGNLIFTMIVSAVLAILMILSMVMGMSTEDRKYAIKGKIKLGGTFISVLLLLIAMAASFLLLWKYGDSLIAGILYGLMLLCGYFSVRFMRARTKRGAELLGKLLGFKEFIKVAELEKLQMLVEEDPSYFYNVLPYAYVLGLSKKWAKKFENIPVANPGWYSGDGDWTDGQFINTWGFVVAMDRFSSGVSDNIHIPSEAGVSGSFGGSGGGGISSGGGFGGGGGGSW